MYPNIARLKGYTYASSVLCNIGVKLIDHKTNKITIAPNINITPPSLSGTALNIA